MCLVEYKWIRGEPTGFSWTSLEWTCVFGSENGPEGNQDDSSLIVWNKLSLYLVGCKLELRTI